MRRSILHIILCLLLLLLVGGFSACSPQQRLSCLLRHHPELKVRDTVQVFDLSVPIAPASDTLYLPIDYSDTPCDRYCDSLLQSTLTAAGVSPEATSHSVTASHARASLTYADHTLALVATQLPDTVIVQQEVRVPVVEYVAVTKVLPERPIRTFFRISGIIAWSLIALLIVLRIVRFFS